MMQRSLHFTGSLLALLVLPYIVNAQVSFVEVERPYDPYLLTTDIPWQQTLYGDLQGFPDLFEFTITATSTIPIVLRAIDLDGGESPFSLILVRDEAQRGVSEVLRLVTREIVWEPYTDRQTKMSYLTAPTITPNLEPGTYRLEVSTPDNEGRYAIVFGENVQRLGYLAAWQTIRSIHDFHGYGAIHMLRTSHAQIPFLIILILLGMAGTWYYARRRRWL